ncbi:hypothetical protein [Streptomyces sp. ICBB 8177]|uniref:hypothetical protein n=1 Tax=Streptomyces sp. ICBB 8177 TaxID=563922 RepID=UPI000D684895|nr:hypothetical protein [Streptomyces sp. ICBB 8177]PWI44710.1 hypothetical protein CK485_08030 [Streptomyces sp. ICBB 8177]
MTTGRGSRVTRAAMFASVCVPFAALGHILMSGAGIPGWMLLIAGAVTAGVGWAFAGRERGRGLVTGVTVVVQLALHSLFSLGQAVAAPSGAGSPAQRWAAVLLCGPGAAAGISPADAERVVRTAGLGGHLNAPPSGMSSTPGMRDMAGMANMPGMSSGHGAPAVHAATSMGMSGMGAMAHGYGLAGMVAAHVLAAVLCGVWLAYGERAAFQLGRAVAARLFSPLVLLLWTPPTALRPLPRRGGTRSRRRARSLLLAHAIVSRGPPRAAVVLPA